MLISYVVPCYQSGSTIEVCIEAILNQQDILEKEIIVVDSSPNQLIWEKLSKYKDVHYIHSLKKLNPGEARNHGIRLAKGAYIATIDSDVVINPGWTIKMLEKYKEVDGTEKKILLGGSLINAKQTDSYLMNALVMIEFYESLLSKRRERRKKIPAMNMFFAQKIKSEMLFSSSRMAEDMMLCRGFIEKGGEIYFLGDNWVEHITNHSFIKANYRLGIGSANYRLSSSKYWMKVIYWLGIPVGVIYKYLGVLVGLMKYNPPKIMSLLYLTPPMLLGLMVYNLGMVRGALNSMKKHVGIKIGRKYR